VAAAHPTHAAGDRVDALTQRRPLTMHHANVETTWTDILTALLTQGLIAFLLLLAA
jgi:hypothetical protein